MFHRFRSLAVQGGALLALVMVVFPGSPSPAWGQAADVFEVAGVAVDVTAETAAQAREKALVVGEAGAFRRLLERLTVRADQPRLPEISGGEVARYVKDFDVANEKTSPVRYLASLNVRFQAEAVRDLLRRFGLPFAETPSKPVLVLPVLERDGRVLLWDEPNPWRRAWLDLPPANGLVPYLHPLGDLTDIAAVSGEQALAGDGRRMASIAERYGAGDSLVAQGVLEGDRGGLPRVRIVATRYGAVSVQPIADFVLVAGAEESAGDLLRRAAAEVVVRTDEQWKTDNLLRFGAESLLPVVIPIDGLRDWTAVRRSIGDAAIIRDMEVVLMSRSEVRANIHYIGDPEQLGLALQQRDLDLFHDGSGWILQRSGRARIQTY